MGQRCSCKPATGDSPVLRWLWECFGGGVDSGATLAEPLLTMPSSPSALPSLSPATGRWRSCSGGGSVWQAASSVAGIAVGLALRVWGRRPRRVSLRVRTCGKKKIVLASVSACVRAWGRARVRANVELARRSNATHTQAPSLHQPHQPPSIQRLPQSAHRPPSLKPQLQRRGARQCKLRTNNSPTQQCFYCAGFG
ncbi:hypothetical protein DFJ73DRAFT_848600 [Zopfochytrium polystomum]|nr:hypothetical protein DFJ73DRAFT_848600 [Zopfochytrium polystomum]